MPQVIIYIKRTEIKRKEKHFHFEFRCIQRLISTTPHVESEVFIRAEFPAVLQRNAKEFKIGSGKKDILNCKDLGFQVGKLRCEELVVRL